MTEDVSSGRLVAEVVSDTTGFARDAKRKLDAEVRALRVRIKAEIDTKGLIGQARAAAKEASRAAVVKLKVELDTKGLIGQTRAAAKQASAAAVVKLRAEVSTKQVVAQAKTAAAEASRAGVTMGVDANTSKADADINALKEKVKRNGVDLPVKADTSSLNTASVALKQLSKAPAIAGGIFLLGTAVVQLGGGLLAVASAGAQAVGVVGALPNLIGVVAQGAASLLIGLSGVGGALSAMGKAEEATTAATTSGGAAAKATARAVESAARQRVAAAQAVKDAQQSLRDATEAAADQEVSGARAIADAQRALADAREDAVERARAAIERASDAEWSLARAQENSADAQQNLSRARAAAQKRIEDLNAALKSGSLSEEEATLALQKARENLQDIDWNVMSSDLDQKEGALAVKQAEDDLARIQGANKDLATEAAKANKDGVEGSDQVKDAREGVRDALHAEQEDTENLANAQRELAKSGRDSARAIADAQRSVADAIEANKDGAVAAARAIEQAQRGVVSAQQGYVDAQRAVSDANETAAAGSTAAAAAQTALAAAMAKLSPAGRAFAKFIFSLKPEWLSLRNTVQQALLPPIQRGIAAALPLLGTLQTGLVDSATVAGGLGESLGKALGEKSFRNDVGTIMESNNRAMQSFGNAGLSVVQILRHLAVASGPLVERFADWVEKLAAGAEEEIKVGRETGKLERWLDKAGDTAALLGSIVGNLVGALYNTGKAAAPAGRELLETFNQVTQKWQEFTGSEEGQARMAEFFAATKPVTEELGRLVVNLLEFITKAGEGGGGSLNGFLQTLNFLLSALNKIMEIPGAAPVLGWLLTLAGVGGALGLVASVVLRMGKNLGKLGKVTGISKLVSSLRGAETAADGASSSIGSKLANAAKTAGSAVASGARTLAGWAVSAARAGAAAAVTTARIVAQRVATLAMTVVSGVARVATLAWAVAQTILNFAMSPLGLVILAVVLAVGLLVAGFIYAWKHSETFRKIVTGALEGLKNAASAVFNALGTAVRWVIDFVGKNWKLIVGILGGPIAAAILLIVTHRDKIKSVFGALVDWLKNSFKLAWAGIQAMLTDPIGTAKAVLEKILGKLGLQKTFNDAVTAIKSIWDGLQDASKKPIKFIVETVLNAGLIDGFNWIAGKVGVPNIPHIPLPPGFAAGGHYTGQIPGKKSKTDNILAHGPRGEGIGLATGEYIVNSDATAENLPLLNLINSGKARLNSAVAGFANGGLFGSVKNAIGKTISAGKDFGGDVLDFLRDPSGWFKKRMAGPLDRMKELGSSPYAEIVKGVPRKIVDSVGSKAKELLAGVTGGGSGGPINPGLDGALQWVKTQVGKPYLWGGVGPDGYDCSGLMGAIVNVIRGAEDPFRRLFATGTMPAGIFEKGRGAFEVAWFTGNPGHTAGTLNGQNVESRGGRGVLAGPQARGADDPLFNSGIYHLPGYASGGVVGDPPFDLLSPRGKYGIPNADDLLKTLGVTFDTGGWLSPKKATLAVNKTGQDEAILNPGAWHGASSVLDQVHALARQIRATGNSSTGGGAPLVGSLQLTVGTKDDLREGLDEVDHYLRVIKRGGTHASSTP